MTGYSHPLCERHGKHARRAGLLSCGCCSGCCKALVLKHQVSVQGPRVQACSAQAYSPILRANGYGPCTARRPFYGAGGGGGVGTASDCVLLSLVGSNYCFRLPVVCYGPQHDWRSDSLLESVRLVLLEYLFGWRSAGRDVLFGVWSLERVH